MPAQNGADADARPKHWDTFARRADDLHRWALAPATPPADWPAAERAGWTLWLARYATGAPAADPAVAARTAAVLRDVHALLPALPALDRSAVVQAGLDYVERLRVAGDHEPALALLRDVLLPIADEAPELRCLALLTAAEVARRTFHWPESAAWLDAAAAAATTAAQRVLVAVNRGSLQLERGLPDLAFGHAAEARALAEASGAATDAWTAAFLELRLAYATGRPELARDVLQQTVDRHGAALGAERVRRLQVRAAMTWLQEPAPAPDDAAAATAWLRAATAELAPDERRLALGHLVLHALATGDLAAAAADLDAAEALAGDRRTLDERNLGVPALRLRWALDAGLPDAELAPFVDAAARGWRELEERWADEPLQRTGLGPLFLVNRQRVLGELLRAELRTAGTDAALALWLRVERHGSMARAVAAPSPSVAAVRQRFRNGRGALVFATGPEHGLLFAIDGDGVHAFALDAGTLTIERHGRALMRALAAARAEPSARGELTRAAAALRDLLLPAAARTRLQRWRAVAIVGADMVGDVPFELLPLDDGRLLGASHALSYLPSLVVDAWLPAARPTAVAAQLQVELLACPDVPPRDPQLVAQVQRLPWSDADAARLRAPLGERGTLSVRTGREATLAHRATAPVAAGLLEVIAHGVRDEARIDPQGILLGDGSVAWPQDFERADLPRHVVFAACRAGRGRLRRGDDGRHLLGGSALLAGARGVVVPSLDVGYADARRLLAHLHGELAAGLPFEEALRRARVAVGGAAGERSLEPFLFHLHGLGDAALVAPPPASGARTVLGVVIGIGIGGAAALGAVWLARRRRRGAPRQGTSVRGGSPGSRLGSPPRTVLPSPPRKKPW